MEDRINNLLRNIRLIAARWTGHYGLPKWFRSPLSKGEEESNKLVLNLVDFCKYLEEKNNIPKNTLSSKLFDRETYNELVVGGFIVE